MRPAEKKEKRVEGRGRVEASGWGGGKVGSPSKVFLLKNKLPSNPLSNERPRGEQLGEEMATRLHKLLGKA